ncbi:MAG: hypothetical protein RR842_04020 [Gordonibacter sp.]|uniref:hypothetical protein n=1 Tax=Gordonibacter sp. TaxID=1968902 RepID=UPI002FC96C77
MQTVGLTFSKEKTPQQKAAETKARKAAEKEAGKEAGGAVIIADQDSEKNAADAEDEAEDNE